MLEAERIKEASFEYYARLRKVRDFAEQHSTDGFTLARAAKVDGLSENYFSSFFHDKVGIRFSTWVNHLRVRKAMDLLSSRNLQITDVAYRVGFGDLRTFQRAFRRHTGTTASAFKKAVRP